MNTTDVTENTEKKSAALPAKKVSDSETHQLHVVIHPDINGFGRLFGKVTHVGHTSMEVRVDTYREEQDGTRHPINRAYFVMVAMGDDGKPTPVPGLILENDGERMEWDNAIKRRELRLVRKKEGF